jgi:hypothetical protein
MPVSGAVHRKLAATSKSQHVKSVLKLAWIATTTLLRARVVVSFLLLYGRTGQVPLVLRSDNQFKSRTTIFRLSITMKIYLLTDWTNFWTNKMLNIYLMGAICGWEYVFNGIYICIGL